MIKSSERGVLVYSTDWYDEYPPGPTTAVEAIAEAERGEREDEAFRLLIIAKYGEEADSYPEDLEEMRKFDPATDREWLWEEAL
jgi:hypothetical protein